MRPAELLRILALTGSLAAAGGWVHGPVAAAAGSPPDATRGARSGMSQLTLKERSSRKAMDEQRVNDCKVPLNQRGGRRSPACGTP